MTRKFIITSAILIFIVSPAIAWGVVASQYRSDPTSDTPSTKVTPATKKELLDVVTKKHKESHIEDGSDIKILDVVSYENLHTWWYIVKVKYASYGKEYPVASPMLLVKYFDGPNTVHIITNPGESLPFYDISDSVGIPYDVIDKYNKVLETSQLNPEEEED